MSGLESTSRKRLKAGFDIDIKHCSRCGGDMKIIVAILEKTAIIKILDHPGLPARAPPGTPKHGKILDFL